MPIRLFRVDERLIHGQVTVGWGTRLRPDRFVVVDDRLAGSESEWERELIGLGTEVEAHFVTVDEARELVAAWRKRAESAILLTRDIDHMLRLARGGLLRGVEINLGGIHHAPGRQKVLPYLFLDSADTDRIRELDAEGVTVVAQELPGSPRTEAQRLLG